MNACLLANRTGHLLLFLLVAMLVSSSVFADNETAITYSVDTPTRVSMAVYNEAGQLVRTLMNAERHQPGEHRIGWDGRDATGNPLPAGTYQWRMIRGQGFTPHYLTMLGLPEGHFHWPGGHSGPNGLERVGDTIYMAAGTVEGSAQFIAFDMNTGKVKWYQKPFGGFAWTQDIAAQGDKLFILGMQGGRGQMAILNRGGGGYVSGWADWKRINFTNYPTTFFDFGRRGSQQPNTTVVAPDATFSRELGHGWWEPETIDPVKVGDRMGQGTAKRDGPQRGKFRIRDLLRQPTMTTVTFGNPLRVETVIEYKITGTGVRGAKVEKIRLGPNETKSVTVKGGSWWAHVDVGNPEGAPRGWALMDIQLAPWAFALSASDDEVVQVHTGNVLTWIDPLYGDWDDKKYRAERRPKQAYFHMKVDHSTHVDTQGDLRDVAHLRDGTLVALSPTQLLSVRRDGATKVLIDGLDDAKYVDADPDTGDIFIAEWGDSHQVLKYNESFERVAAFGREGGRQQGRYVPTDFNEVTAIAGDGRGGFIIGEGRTAPVRTAHFDAQGNLIREWLGGLSFFTHAWVDPKPPHRVWIDAGHGWLTEYDFDFKTGKHSVYATYKVNDFGNDHINTYPIQRTGYKGFHVRHKNGRTFLCNINTLTVIEIDEQAREARPVSVLQMFAHNKHMIKEDQVPPSIGFAEAKKNNYLAAMWNDLNRDGDVQPEEVEPSSILIGGMAWVDDDLNYYTTRGKAAFKIEPRWEDGLPAYPAPTNAMRIPAAGSIRDEEGNFYEFYKGGQDKEHGFGWPSTMAAADVGLLKFAPDGTQLFDVGTKAATWPGSHPEGQLHFPVLIPGLAKGAVGLSERSGMPVKFWTKDGLYMGHLFNKMPDDDVPDLAYRWFRIDRNKPDSFGPNGNQALFQADMDAGGRLVEVDGEAYFFGAGWNAVPVYRVEGFDDFTRSQGSIALAQEASPVKLEGDGLTALLYADGDFDGRPDETTIVGMIKGHMKPYGGWSRKVDYKKAGVAYEAWLMPPMTDDYQFLIYGGGTFRLLIDGKPVMDDSNGKRSPEVRLTGGVPVKVRLENKGSNKISLSWETPEIDVEFIKKQNWYTQKP